MHWIALMVAAYSLVLAGVYFARSHRGVFALNLGVLAGLVCSQLWLWPAEYGTWLSPRQLFWCNATSGVPLALVVMSGGWLFLYLLGEREPGGRFGTGLTLLLVLLVVAVPGLSAELYWAVGVLGCDTL